MKMEKKDWIGDKNSVYKTLGASNHTDKARQKHDFYATDPIAIDKLKAVFDIPKRIYECACGRGQLSERLKELGHIVYSSDLYNHDYGERIGIDFLQLKSLPSFLEDFSILTNPPYKFALDFVLKGLELVKQGNYVFMFLKVLFLEGKKRYKELYSKYPPKFVFVSTERILCAKNADFEGMRADGGSAVAYAWFVWQKGYVGDTILKWM